jgi:hypothetical protein
MWWWRFKLHHQHTDNPDDYERNISERNDKHGGNGRISSTINFTFYKLIKSPHLTNQVGAFNFNL